MSQVETQTETTNRQIRSQLPLTTGLIVGGSFVSAASHSEEPAPAEQEIARTLLYLGIPPHIKGFSYICEAVKMLLESEDKIFGITKILYPDIARLHDTTSTRVERAIRHAIEISWSREDTSARNLFSGRKSKPSNAEFLAYLSRSISLNMLS